MADNPDWSRHYDVQAGRDALVAGRDIHVQYISYNRTWSDGVAQPPLVAGSGGVTAPYRGLSPFREEDAALFFGREQATARMLGLMSEHLNGPGLLVMSGVSGAGKSSLLRAGILPRLRRDGLAAAPSAGSWPGLVLNPSDSPLDDLADLLSVMLRVPASALRAWLAADPANFRAIARQAALSVARDGYLDASQADATGRLLIIVDQCEKLFTQCTERSRDVFLSALCAASARYQGRGGPPTAMVVLAIRADYETRLAEYRPHEFPELGQAVQDRFLLRAMNEQELRLTIIGPAGKAGFRVDESLVQALLGEMRTSAIPDGRAIGAGTLPLLSHALDQAWRARAGHDLELADYERIGGIQRAVAMTAQEAYEQLTGAQRQVARTVFTRLVATRADGADTAIRVPVTDLAAGQEPGRTADVGAVLEAFVSRRLLTMAVGTVEISHESLLSAWPLLRDTWLAETRADRIVRTRLHATAAEWERQSRDPSYLYRGSLLQEAAASTSRTEAAPVRNPPLSPRERDFLAASTRATRRSERRLRGTLAVFVVLALAASAFAVISYYSAANARQQQAMALSRQLATESLAAVSINLVTARQLAVAAWHAYPTDQAKAAMLTMVAGQQEGILPVTTDGSAVTAVTFSPDGKVLATAGSDGNVRLWNTATGRPVGAPLTADTTGKYTGVNGVAFSPDGNVLATADADGEVRLWNTATGQPIGAPLTADTTGKYTGANGVATSPRGRDVDGGTIFVGVQGVAFSPDGTMLAAADANGTARLWRITGTGAKPSFSADGTLLADVSGQSIGVEGVAFSPDSKTLATADGDHSVRLWNASSKNIEQPPLAGPDTILGVAFSPNGKMLATANSSSQRDGSEASLWNLANGQLITSFPARDREGGTIDGVAFDPDGTMLATAGSTGIQLWNTATGKPVGNPLPADTTGTFVGAQGVALSPNGALLAAADVNGTARLWRLTSTGAVSPLSADATITADANSDNPIVSGVAFSLNGKMFATAEYSDGTAQLWDTATDRPIGKPLPAGGSGAEPGVNGVAFSPDGTMLATADDNGEVQLWSTATGQPIGNSITADSDGVNRVAFSPDGTMLATAGTDGEVRLWDTTGRLIGKPIPADTNGTGLGVMGVAFSPDGKILATANDDDTVGRSMARLWNTATGQPIGGPLLTGSDGVAGVAFSPDGTMLATAGDDGTAQLWDTATGQLIASFPTGTGGLSGVAFRPDGKVLATADADGTVRLWTTPLTVDPYQALCSGFGPPTQDEWTQYAPGEPFPQVC
jgi:WD40 repeat protein